jgi:hypothetical protein
VQVHHLRDQAAADDPDPEPRGHGACLCEMRGGMRGDVRRGRSWASIAGETAAQGRRVKPYPFGPVMAKALKKVFPCPGGQD